MSIDVEVTAGVCTIMINRPERLNAMDAEHYQALSQAWCHVRDDAGIRVAIITGAGESEFVRGACWMGPITQVAVDRPITHVAAEPPAHTRRGGPDPT